MHPPYVPTLCCAASWVFPHSCEETSVDPVLWDFPLGHCSFQMGTATSSEGQQHSSVHSISTECLYTHYEGKRSFDELQCNKENCVCVCACAHTDMICLFNLKIYEVSTWYFIFEY